MYLIFIIYGINCLDSHFVTVSYLPGNTTSVLRDLPLVYIYLDDILVTSNSPDEHRKHLRQLFERLVAYGLVVNPKNCVLGKSRLSATTVHTVTEGIPWNVELLQTIRASGCRHLESFVRSGERERR